MRLGIVGAGAMGTWFARFGKEKGWDVSITDIDTRRAKKVSRDLGIEHADTSEEVATNADIVLVAVPIAVTPNVMEEVAGYMRSGSLLMDVASAKAEVIDEMGKLSEELEVVSLHPLFGPGAKSVRGRIFISIPVRPGKIYHKFKRLLESLGAEVVEMTADEHDHLMATTQCMAHFILMAYISALRSTKNVEMAKKLQTPFSSALFRLAEAFLATNPDVHGELQIHNKYASIARSAVLEACRSLSLAFDAGDAKVLRKIFEDASKIVGKAEAKSAYKKLYEEDEG
ncbi:MAG: prephenate dehydrogenase/arogenate dehydrogenase family protein [Hadesarchaea archaeon]|nr:prephenate dehydrogenase/arogenate dehydrogenase family protein [Hadesarchaea archaeon]